MATETRFWTEEEDRLVLLSRLPAKQLSAELDRSCLAIYSRRAYLRELLHYIPSLTIAE